MGHLTDFDELFEVFSQELTAVVTDDSGVVAGVVFASFLHGDFRVSFGHGLIYSPA